MNWEDSRMIRTYWAEHDRTLLRLAVFIMAVAALVWLGYEFWRLWQPDLKGAVDLKSLHKFTVDWFAGKPIYRESTKSVYPPATYAILWPVLGWLSLPASKWIFAGTAILALMWCVRLVVRECETVGPLERAFAALIPCSMYATGAAIGNGQFTVHALTALMAGLLLMRRRPQGWYIHLLVPALVLIAFVKPTLAAPFFWILLFVPDSPRPALFAASGYVLLTLFAANFQGYGLATLLGKLLTRSSYVGRTGAQTGNVANLHILLIRLGLPEWSLPVSLLLLIALGFWTYYHRRVELWLLMGVTAYVARIYTYHRWYDDLLILLPMVAFFLIARKRPAASNEDVVAGILLAATILASLAPGGLFLFPEPWNSWYVAGQVLLWTAGLVFLVRRAWIEKKRTD